MTSAKNVVRFSISLPPTLVNKFDQFWRDMGYSNRSKAVHDAFRSLITEYEWMYREEGEITGAIVLLFYLDKPRLLNKIAKIQQKYKNVIVSTMNLHISTDKILEIIAVKGDAKHIKNLIQELTTEKGIKQLKFSAIAV